MSNKQLKDWRGWIITAEQIEAIKAHDREAINKFYFDNEKRFSKSAMNYSVEKSFIERGAFYDYRDYLQQLYLDLPYLDYSSAKNFRYSIFNKSFYNANKGGLAYLVETKSKYLSYDYGQTYNNTYLIVDAPAINKSNEDSNKYLIDYLASSPSAEEVVFSEEDSLEELKDLLLTFLTPKEYQYYLYYYRGLTPSVILERFGISKSTDAQVKMKLRLHFKEIIKALDDLGVECVEPYKTKICVAYDEALKRAEERKRKDSERQRKRYKEGKIKPYTEEQKERRRKAAKARYKAKKLKECIA